jgi:hypothetical protein
MSDNIYVDMKLRAIDFVMSQDKSKTMELELAKKLKTEFDTKYHPTWQCIVGKSSILLIFETQSL